MARKDSSAVVKSTVDIMKERATARKKQIKRATANLKKAGEMRAAALKKQQAAKRRMEAKLGPRAFTQTELKKFKSIILEKRHEMLEELDTLKESMMDITTGEYVAESSTYSLHMEQGTDAMEREKTFLFAARGSKFVVQLDEAIARIGNGTYGICRVCGLLVPKERLEAVPTAQTCAEYKNSSVPCERGKMVLGTKKAIAE